MRIIPVLDLAGGRAVHARGGDRAAYAPVRSVLAGPPGDAAALARACAERGATELYVADLDAIRGGPPQREPVESIARAGVPVLLDAGAADAAAARAAIAAGAARVVIGLETLRGFDDLASIVATVGRARVVFSLDLRAGVPMLRSAMAGARDASPVVLAERARDCGVGSMIVLDLARVGSGRGLDLVLLAALRRALSDAELLAGGGVRDGADLARLSEVGCDGVLVGTALHEGRIAIGEKNREGD